MSCVNKLKYYEKVEKLRRKSKEKPVSSKVIIQAYKSRSSTHLEDRQMEYSARREVGPMARRLQRMQVSKEWCMSMAGSTHVFHNQETSAALSSFCRFRGQKIKFENG